ncbi:MAG: TIGR04086 family membrane protein [Lachnospirales bacterium]
MESVHSRKGAKSTSKEMDFTSRATLMFIAVLKSYLFTLIVILVVASLLTYTDFTTKYVSAIVVVTTAFACFLIGFDFSRQNKEKGLLFGALGGLIYILIYIILSYALAEGAEFGVRMVIMSVVGVLIGATGGILGVNGK